jgi:peptidoglycan/xylan/chitin deacetylase (PgdA/CDA1 family)
MFYSIKNRCKLFVNANKYRLTGAINCVRIQKPVAALTFDDGPNREFTPALLDVLDRHNAKATFFIAGKRIEEHIDILERMFRNGHCVGNHSWDHPSLPLLTGAERRKQIRRCQTALGKYDSGLLRPPFGNMNFISTIDIHRCGYRIIGWSADAEDWLDHSADFIYEKLSSRIKFGSIVLLHDNLIHYEKPECIDRSPTIQAVEKLLSTMRSFQFVTVSRLLELGTPLYRPLKIESNKDWLGSLIHSTN